MFDSLLFVKDGESDLAFCCSSPQQGSGALEVNALNVA